jgi:cytochrome c oxidase assembly factor CtaG
MTTAQLFLTAWSWEPSIIDGCIALLLAYGVACVRWPPVNPSRFLLFIMGVLVLLFALVSPLDTLGDTYLFSAHMAQHMLLIQVAPPLLLLGVPTSIWRRLLTWVPADRLERKLGQPLVAWPIGMGTLWVWHVPTYYNAVLGNESLHIFQHVCFLVTATIFWWPVVAPLAERRRLPSWAAVGYLMLGALATSILGIVLTFSPAGIYPAYLHPADPLGIVPLLRDGWGLTPAADQRLGGGLMWTVGGLIYLLAIVLTVVRWFGELDEATEQEDGPLATEEASAVAVAR